MEKGKKTEESAATMMVEKLGEMVYKLPKGQLESSMLFGLCYLGFVMGFFWICAVVIVYRVFLGEVSLAAQEAAMAVLLIALLVYLQVILFGSSFHNYYEFHEKGIKVTGFSQKKGYWFNVLYRRPVVDVIFYGEVEVINLEFSENAQLVKLKLVAPWVMVSAPQLKAGATGKRLRSWNTFKGESLPEVLPLLIQGIGWERFSEILKSNVDNPMKLLVEGGYVKIVDSEGEP